MIPVIIEAAARSLLVGLAVGAGLRIFKVRNVPAQKAAWGLVLVSAMCMPLLLPLTAQWHLLPASFNVVLPADRMTLLEELQARILAKSGPASKPAAAAQSELPRVQESTGPEQAAAPRAPETPSAVSPENDAAKPEQDARLMPDSIEQTWSPLPVRWTPSAAVLALTVYCVIAGLFLARLLLGLSKTLWLWRTATPVPMDDVPHGEASVPLRASGKIASPVTVGSAILLPADYKGWDTEKLRIVLAHERSHIRQGDFYLQLLASLYAALVWVSPLGWWLKHELAELGEAISDRAAMEEAASRTSYAQILLEFAAAPHPLSIGVAMARPGSLSRRIERLLNDNSFRQCFAGGSRAMAAIALVPVALLASTVLVRVQAATDTQSALPIVAAESRATGIIARPQIEAVQAQAAVLAAPQLSATSVATMIADAKAPEMEPAAGMTTGGMQEETSLTFDRTLNASANAQLTISTGAGNIHIKRGSGNQIQIHGRIHVSQEGSEDQARQIAANPPIVQEGDVIHVGQHQEHWHGISIDYDVEAPAGTVLAANSGSGNIVDEGVGENAKLQTGSGDIEATSLEGPFMVKTGSGNITAAQTGQGDVVAETGSGTIELKDIHGSFHGQTGSGDIKASGTPAGSWVLQTGSGNIELQTGNAGLTLDASTGSGSVITEHQMMVQGTFDRHHVIGTLNGGGPTVRVQTGSGDVQIH